MISKSVKFFDLGVAGSMAINEIEPAFCFLADNMQDLIKKVEKAFHSYYYNFR